MREAKLRICGAQSFTFTFICPLGKTRNHRSRGDTPWEAHIPFSPQGSHASSGPSWEPPFTMRKEGWDFSRRERESRQSCLVSAGLGDLGCSRVFTFTLNCNHGKTHNHRSCGDTP